MLKTKQDFIKALKNIINPLKKFYTPKKAGIKLGNFGVFYSDEIAKMEAFSRVLWGLAPLWADGDSADEFDEIYLQGIINGTDPESPEYWGDVPKSDQRLVEMTALGFALILAPHKIWNPLTQKQKNNLHRWLLQVNCDIPNDNNWQLFPLIVNLGLKSVGVSYDAQRIKFAIEKCHSYYISNGWYHDGQLERSDYYVAFALHFYSLIYAKVMENEDPENSRIFKERAETFAKSFIYWFDENGSSLAIGRSLTYRFAQCSFFGACLFAGVKPFPVGVMKGIISRHFDWWLSQPIFDNAGILTVGYAYPNLNMSEQYNAYGSPYWAFKAFIFLALNQNDEFFNAEPLPLPKLKKVLPIPEAYMTVQRVNGYSVALSGGQWANWGLSHRAEKYSKFAYSSRYAFSVSRVMDTMENAAPDSSLAFDIDGTIFYRRKCIEYSMDKDGNQYSKWSPCRGIIVETTLIPIDNGHIRQHKVVADFECTAYDTTFATPIGSGGEIIGQGENVIIKCVPNTNLIHPITEIKAIKYKFPKGTTTIETKVIYP